MVALDDFSTGTRDNLRGLQGDRRFSLREADVRDPSAFDGLSRPDVIFHLAAAVGVRNILENPLQSLQINLRGTENALAAAQNWGAEIIVASTSEVYGKNDASALREDADRVLGAGELSRWWYAVAKMADESLALASHRESRLRAIVVRLFNTVGARQTGRYGMVLPNLVRQALAGEPLTVYGDGEQTRCFTYVLDTVKALRALSETPSAYGQIFNVGQPVEISINALAERIIQVTGSRSGIVHISYDEAYGDSYEDMRRRVPDCTRLRAAIGFAPTDRLDEAIQSVVEELRKQGICEPA